MNSDDLPKKFTDAERRAYQWLYDCQIRGWMVDLKTKRVTALRTVNGEEVDEFATLVTFAKYHGMKL